MRPVLMDDFFPPVVEPDWWTLPIDDPRWEDLEPPKWEGPRLQCPARTQRGQRCTARTVYYEAGQGWCPNHYPSVGRVKRIKLIWDVRYYAEPLPEDHADDATYINYCAAILRQVLYRLSTADRRQAEALGYGAVGRRLEKHGTV